MISCMPNPNIFSRSFLFAVFCSPAKLGKIFEKAKKNGRNFSE